MKIILATSNPHKIDEIKLIMNKGFDFVPVNTNVEEDGMSFAENAIKKAEFAYEKYGSSVIADDSGLEIDALKGLLGIRSARFMEKHPYEEKNAKILEMMKNVSDDKRTARFKCVAVYYDGSPHIFEGVIEGKIAKHPKGENGFGYDPIFIPYGYRNTMAELPSSVKNKISHRAQAFKKVSKYLTKKSKNIF